MRRFSGYCALVFMAAFGLFAGDVTDAQRRLFEEQEALRQRDLESHVTARYVPGTVVTDACENGDFESGFDGWSGAFGNVAYGTEEPDLTNLTAGISQGPINRSHARQTLVSADAGPDKYGISQVAPGGSTRAVRIGNAFYGGGVELLERTFVVPRIKPFLGFRYAVVLEDPDHDPLRQPLFRVRVLDAEGKEISGVVDLTPEDEARVDRLVAASGNPFFTILPRPSVPIVYRDWTCASIDLSGHVGKVVTVQFITEDCSELGHWGYAYVDNFCDTGWAKGFAFDEGESTKCGVGRLCFDYALPAGKTVVIRLSILRDGVVVDPRESPILDSGTLHCFPVDPIADFDYIATATFSSGTVESIGAAPDGVKLGMNNDYPVCPSCGSGSNLVRNGDFESGNAEFSSAFTHVPAPVAARAVRPGEYAVVDETQAVIISPTWVARSHELCDSTGKFLAVNGDTGKVRSRPVWSQTISVVPETAYRFCAWLRNLEQCALDVKPRIELRFSSPPDASVPSVIDAARCIECDWKLESRRIVIPAGVTSLTAEIWLDESAKGDANDLAIDDISLRVEAAEVIP